ncbi:CAP-GLY domain-containing linker protein 3, partial [Xenoophorus captivus]
QKKKTSVASLDPEGTNVEVGDQVLVAGQKLGIVRFYGKTDFAPGVCSPGSFTSGSFMKELKVFLSVI